MARAFWMRAASAVDCAGAGDGARAAARTRTEMGRKRGITTPETPPSPRLRWASRHPIPPSPKGYGGQAPARKKTADGRLSGMRLFTQIGLPALACLLAAGCGELPTAPSSTEPTTGTFTEPYPAPVSQTATGTWFLGERRFMTLTQDGTSVTGMPSPA